MTFNSFPHEINHSLYNDLEHEDMNIPVSDIFMDINFLQSNCPNVRLKLAAFFDEWLVSSLNDSSNSLLSELRDSLHNWEGYEQQQNVIESHSGLSSGNSSSLHQINSSTNMSTISHHFTPPLSPTRISPMKRTQEMMLSHKPDISVEDAISNLSMTIAEEKDINENNINDDMMSTPYDDNMNKIKNDKLPVTKRKSNFDVIPTFYIPGKGIKSIIMKDKELTNSKLNEIETFFKPFKDGISFDKFVHVTKRLCNLPSYFNVPFCERIYLLYGNNQNKEFKYQENKISLEMFLQYWKDEMEGYDNNERFFRLLKQPTSDSITKDDFTPYLHEILRFHPGLDFLDGHEEFQRKYALTVITRIFYKVNTSRTGKISLREIKKSKLLNSFNHVDEETDINRVREYFAYEHFYVLYCRFFELDMDKDSKLTREDLMKYADHGLSEPIVDRIFRVGQRAFSDGKEGDFDEIGGMSYPDFIYFMLSEEDKTSEQSIRYWFRCCDLDGDGIMTTSEMLYFYKTQTLRLISLVSIVIL